MTFTFDVTIKKMIISQCVIRIASEITYALVTNIQ